MSLARNLTIYLLLLAVTLLADANSLLAQVSAEVFPKEGTTEDTFRLEVTIRDSGDYSKPRFKRDNIFTLEAAGTTTSQTIINSKISTEHTYTYRLTPNTKLEPGEYETPAGEIEISGRTLVIEPQTFKVSKASAATNKVSQIDFAQTVNNHRPYVGQQLLHTTKLATTVDIRNPNFSEFNPQGFWKESFKESAQQQRVVGSSTAIVNYYEALFPLQPGKATIAPRTLRADAAIQRQAPAPRRGSSVIEQFLFNEMLQFGGSSYQEVSLSTDPLSIMVRELPPAPAKANYIPVGKVALESSIDKQSGSIGDNFTLTIVVSGDANLRPLSLPEFPKETTESFRIYADSPELETEVAASKVIFTKTFKVALVPQVSGELEIPSLKILSFDPDASQYLWLESSPAKVTVQPSTNQNIAQPQTQQFQEPELPTVEEQSAADIRELYPSKLTKQTTLEISNYAILSLVASAPLFVLVIYLWSRAKRLREENPAYLLRKGALLAAMKKLSAKDLSVENVYAAVQQFIVDFFKVPYNLTSDELKQLITREGATPELAEQFAQLNQQLAALRFSGKSPSSQQLTTVKEAAIKLIKTAVSQVKFTLLLFLLLTSTIENGYAAPPLADDNAELAEKAFLEGKFSEAVKLYSSLSDEIDSPYLDYNLGSAHFKAGNFELAKAYLARAAAKLPREAKIKYNLKLVEDKLTNSKSITASDGYFWIPKRALSGSEITFLFIGCYLLFWLVVAVSIVKRKSVALLATPLLLATLYLGFLVFFSCRSAQGNYRFCPAWDRTELAVVTAKNAQARSGDAAHYLVSFLLNGGEYVTVRQQRNGWVQVESDNGLLGWLPESELLLIK